MLQGNGPNVSTRLKALVEKTHLKTKSSTSGTRRRQPKMGPRYLVRSMERGDIVSPKRYDYGDDVHYDLIVVEKIIDS